MSVFRTKTKQVGRDAFGRDDPHITHLLFADDSIVFREASEDSLLELHNILHTHEMASGQKVNYDKSSVFFGKGRDQETCIEKCDWH